MKIHTHETYDVLILLVVLYNSPYKGHWREALMCSSIFTWINGWVNTREAGDLRCYLTHYDVTVMGYPSVTHFEPYSCEICSAPKLFLNCSVWLSLAKRTNEVPPHISLTWSSTISPQFYLVLGFLCQCVIKPIILARNQCENERLTRMVKLDIPPHRVVGTQHGLTHFSAAQFTKSMNFSLCRTAHLPGNISNDNNAVWLEIASPTFIFSFAIVM